MTYEAHKLSKWSIFYRTCFVEVDAMPWQLHLLSSTDASVQNNAVNMEARRRALVEAGGLGFIIDAVNVAVKVEARQNTVAVLFYLSSHPDSQSTATRSAASHGRAHRLDSLVRWRQRPRRGSRSSRPASGLS